MLSHLPILQVILPLLAAPSCLILGRPALAWGFSFATSAAAMLISMLLLQQVWLEGPISYFLGGWEAPWGIEYRIDLLNAFLLLIVSSLSTVVLAGARQSVAAEVEPNKQTLFYVSWLLCLAGLLGILATGDAFNVFVFLEVSSLSTYTLISLGRDRKALWASYQYLIVGTIGATFILIGIGLMYMMTGTLNMQDLAQRLPVVADTRTVFAAYAFVIVGVCLKLALFPLHLWLPNAYAYAPSAVTAFLAATATKVAVYLLIRFSFTVFGADFGAMDIPLHQLFIALGLIAVFSASLVAILQIDIKRAIAYSSVAQIGYMIIGLGLGSAAGLQATLLHLFNHALMKGALFMSLAAVALRMGSTRLNDLAGLSQRMPLTAMAFVLGGLSLIGVPLTVGFISKWYLVIATLEMGMWPVAALILVGSLLAVMYIWRVVEVMYFRDPPASSQVSEAPVSVLLPLWLLVVANIYFGIDTALPVSVTADAAQALLGWGK